MGSALPPVSEKPRFVAAMFGRIARRYDLMNTLMTAGQDGGWRRMVAYAALDGISPQLANPPTRQPATRNAERGTRNAVLDVGTGTGKLAVAVAEAAPRVRVIGVDFTLPMLRAAPRHLHLAGADALQLPFKNEEFDAVVSAFLVRNVADVTAGIAEQVRVLRPGGHLVILETTPGPPGPLGPLYRLYFRYVVPLLGRLIVGDPAAYTYLPESTLAFLEPTKLADLLRRSGLTGVTVRRLALGTVAITAGQKPATRVSE